MASLDMEPAQGWFWEQYLPEKDTRVDGWVLLGNPAPILTILAGYVYIVKVRKHERRTQALHSVSRN